MKLFISALLAFTLSALPAYAVNRTSLNGFRGIAFGENEFSTNRKLANYFDDRTYNNGNVFYVGNIIGKKSIIAPMFTHGKFQALFIGFFCEPHGLIPLLQEVEASVKNVYGEPNLERCITSRSDNLNDREVTKIPLDNAYAEVLRGESYITIHWDFSDGNGVWLETKKSDDSFWVSLMYLSGSVKEDVKKASLNNLNSHSGTSESNSDSRDL